MRIRRDIWRVGRLGMPGFLVILLLLAQTLAGAEARLILDRERMEFGETLGFQVVVEGTQRTAQPVLPTMPGIRSQYLGPTSQMESINGQTTVKVVHRFVLKPDTTNDVVIPPISVRTGNQTLMTQEGRVRVLPFESHEEPVWMKLVVDRDEVVVGDTFPVELHLYFQQIRDPSAPRFDLDGFVLGRSSQPSQAATQRGDQAWSLVIWKFAVTATKPGELKVGPAEVDLTLLLGTAPRRPGSLMDDFFGPPREARRMTVKSPVQALKAIAPPSVGRPAGYAGAVGRFRMAAAASPTELTVGDPTTVRLTVQGEGGIERLDLGPWPEDPSYRVYPGTNGFQPADALGLSGVKTIEYVLVPERPGKLRIPMPPLVYFDPETRRYETAKASDLELTVRPAAGSTVPTGTNGIAGGGGGTGTNGPTLAGAAPIVEWRSVNGGRPLLGTGWARRGLVGGVFALPWVAWLGWAIAGYVRRVRAARPARPVRELWLRESRTLSAGPAASDPGAELSGLSRAVRCWIGWYLDCSPDGITSGIVDGELVRRGLGEEHCEALRRWFAQYEALRFAPGNVAGLSEFRRETLGLLGRLQETEGRS